MAGRRPARARAVATTCRSGAPRIFFGSAISFGSSPVKPSGWNSPIFATTLNAIGLAKTSPWAATRDPGGASDSTSPDIFSTCSASSRVPFQPAPLTA